MWKVKETTRQTEIDRLKEIAREKELDGIKETIRRNDTNDKNLLGLIESELKECCDFINGIGVKKENEYNNDYVKEKTAKYIENHKQYNGYNPDNYYTFIVENNEVAITKNNKLIQTIVFDDVVNTKEANIIAKSYMSALDNRDYVWEVLFNIKSFY